MSVAGLTPITRRGKKVLIPRGHAAFPSSEREEVQKWYILIKRICLCHFSPCLPSPLDRSLPKFNKKIASLEGLVKDQQTRIKHELTSHFSKQHIHIAAFGPLLHLTVTQLLSPLSSVCPVSIIGVTQQSHSGIAGPLSDSNPALLK